MALDRGRRAFITALAAATAGAGGWWFYKRKQDEGDDYKAIQGDMP